MNGLRTAATEPPVYYLHSEADLARHGPEGASGLAAGYLSTRVLEENEELAWERIFDRGWQEACKEFGAGLTELEVDAFAVVPCSRERVVEKLRIGLRSVGLHELPGLIEKKSSEVSFAGKSGSYIANGASIKVEMKALEKVKKVAICDDFAESGRTLLGLHSLLSSKLSRVGVGVLLASVGISRKVGSPGGLL